MFLTPRSATRRHAGRRAASLALVAAMAVSLVGAWGSAPAEATSYRFWSYWTGGSDWTFSGQGASRRPPDGGVDGWRFAISPASSSTIPPRPSASFDALCGSTPAQDGHKRVGLVVDFGTSADAPDGESPPAIIRTCAVVPDDANGYEVLMTVAQLRTDAGLICGINGYPATECGVPVADPTSSPTQQPQNGGGGSDRSSGSDGGGDSAGGTDQGGGSGTGATSDTTPSPSDKETSDKGDQDSKKQRDAKASKTSEATPEISNDASAAAAAGTTAPGSPSSGSPLGLIAGIAVVLGIGAVAFGFARRRP